MTQLIFADWMSRDEAAQNKVRLDALQAQPSAQIDKSPRATRRAYRLVEHVKQMAGALPRGHRVRVDMGAAIHDYEVEQLAHQIENRADRRVADQLAVLDPLGRREQVDSRRMLAERGLELNRVEFAGSLRQRNDRALGLQIQKHREPAGLQVEIHYRDPLVERVAQ